MFASPLAAAASGLDLTPPDKPAHDAPLRPDIPGCERWTDECVTCTRQQNDDAPVCSNIGIACQPKAIRCIGDATPAPQPQGK